MEKLKVGIVGIGFIGAAHIEALNRLGNINIVALTDAVNASDKAQQLSIPNSFNDFKEMIQQMNLDVIHICTPNSTHFTIAKYALEHNIHVICEKPFTATLEEAQELVAIAKTRGLVNAVNYVNRFYPLTHHLKHIVKKGDLGDVLSIHGTYLQDWLLYDTDFNWRLLSASSGKTRVVSDIGSHWLDLVEYTTALNIIEVFADFKTHYKKRKKAITPQKTFHETTTMVRDYEEIPIDTEDYASILLRFDNGSIGNLFISQMFAGKKNQLSLMISGTKASAHWDSEDTNNLLIGERNIPSKIITKDIHLLDPKSAAITSYPAGHVEGFPDALKQSFKQIYHAILNPSSDIDFATFEDGLRIMTICDAIYESALSDKWVML